MSITATVKVLHGHWIAHLIEGVWLVDDLSQVKQGVAVTATG